MITFDTETCGLHGPIVLIQWAEDEGPIHLHEVFRVPVKETLELIERITDNSIIGFNLAFDWFHICQTYTVLRLLDPDKCPDIEEYAQAEPHGRDGPCLKPAGALDLMSHARKTEYQSTMDRKDIRIRKVPRILAQALCTELNKRIPLPAIYFSKAKYKSVRWHIDENSDHPELTDIILKFKPSSALKALATDAFNLDSVTLFEDLADLPKPIEYGWAPFALAVAKPPDWAIRLRGKKSWNFAWPKLIRKHIERWAFNDMARQYAHDDVHYTRKLYHHFGAPAFNDDDSILACMVGAVRWRGYSVDLERMQQQRLEALEKVNSCNFHSAPAKVRIYISEVLSEAESAIIQDSTSKEVLEQIVDWPDHPAAERAKIVLTARKAKKEVELYDKIIKAGRFHAAFKVIGTFSSRMAGGGEGVKFNPQGIKRAKDVRSAFTLGWPSGPGTAGPLDLWGGDFDAFEVSIADKVYNDKNLRTQLCTCSKCGNVCNVIEYCTSKKCSKCGGERRKIHGLLGMELSGLTYDEVAASKGQDPDWYDRGKRGIFALFYGGNWSTLMRRLNITEEIARKAEEGFLRRFPGIGITRQQITDNFTTLTQPGGIGSRVEIQEPADFIESLYGFRRYFTLENRIVKELYTLASKLPPAWRQLEGRIVRRDREQRLGGAVMTALFAAAFGLQGVITRAAGNHVIQSPGATITKALQCKLWELQPPGVQAWRVMPMNIHDEIMCPASVPTEGVIEDFLTEVRKTVPMVKIGWKKLDSWADK